MKTNSIKTKILSMLHSVTFNFLLGVFLVIYSLHDIYDDIFKLSHKHLLLATAIIMIINSLRHLFEGSERLLKQDKNKKIHLFYNKGNTFLEKPIVGIITGLIIIFVGVYDINEGVEELKSYSITISAGVISLIVATTSIIFASKNIIKDIEEEKK